MGVERHATKGSATLPARPSWLRHARRSATLGFWPRGSSRQAKNGMFGRAGGPPSGTTHARAPAMDGGCLGRGWAGRGPTRVGRPHGTRSPKLAPTRSALRDARILTPRLEPTGQKRAVRPSRRTAERHGARSRPGDGRGLPWLWMGWAWTNARRKASRHRSLAPHTRRARGPRACRGAHTAPGRAPCARGAAPVSSAQMAPGASVQARARGAPERRPRSASAPPMPRPCPAPRRRPAPASRPAPVVRPSGARAPPVLRPCGAHAAPMPRPSRILTSLTAPLVPRGAKGEDALRI